MHDGLTYCQINRMLYYDARVAIYGRTSCILMRENCITWTDGWTLLVCACAQAIPVSHAWRFMAQSSSPMGKVIISYAAGDRLPILNSLFQSNNCCLSSHYFLFLLTFLCATCVWYLSGNKFSRCLFFTHLNRARI